MRRSPWHRKTSPKSSRRERLSSPTIPEWGTLFYKTQKRHLAELKVLHRSQTHFASRVLSACIGTALRKAVPRQGVDHNRAGISQQCKPHVWFGSPGSVGRTKQTKTPTPCSPSDSPRADHLVGSPQPQTGPVPGNLYLKMGARLERAPPCATSSAYLLLSHTTPSQFDRPGARFHQSKLYDAQVCRVHDLDTWSQRLEKQHDRAIIRAAIAPDPYSRRFQLREPVSDRPSLPKLEL